MKQYVSVLIFFFTITSVSAQTKEEQEVIQLSKNKFRWMTEMKLDSLERVLDDRLMFIHSNGWTENKQEFIADIKSGKLHYLQIEPRDVVVRLYQKTAVLTGKGNFKVLLDGTELVINLSYTEVYVQKKGKWLLASRHANRLP
jgi:hypothetical protein